MGQRGNLWKLWKSTGTVFCELALTFVGVRGEVEKRDRDGNLESATGTVEVVRYKTKIDTEFKAKETRRN